MQTKRHRRDYPGRASRWIAVGAMVLGILSAISAQAESYIAGQVGYTLASDAQHVRTVDSATFGIPNGTEVSNVNLNNSLMYGMKFGHYFASTPWLGVELEGFMTNPQVPQQQLTLNVPGAGAISVNQPGASNRLIVMSPNLVVRYQAGGFEPYVGVGPGVFFLNQQRDPAGPGVPEYSQSSTRVGLNTQVGLRYRLTEQVSVFGEWKYNYVQFNLSGQEAGPYYGFQSTVQLHHFVFGVGYHF